MLKIKIPHEQRMLLTGSEGDGMALIKSLRSTMNNVAQEPLDVLNERLDALKLNKLGEWLQFRTDFNALVLDWANASKHGSIPEGEAFSDYRKKAKLRECDFVLKGLARWMGQAEHKRARIPEVLEECNNIAVSLTRRAKDHADRGSVPATSMLAGTPRAEEEAEEHHESHYFRPAKRFKGKGGHAKGRGKGFSSGHSYSNSRSYSKGRGKGKGKGKGYGSSKGKGYGKGKGKGKGKSKGAGYWVNDSEYGWYWYVEPPSYYSNMSTYDSYVAVEDEDSSDMTDHYNFTAEDEEWQPSEQYRCSDVDHYDY